MGAGAIIAGAAFLIPTIAGILGIKDPTQLSEEMYAQFANIVNSSYSKWVEKANRMVAGGSLSASQIGRPDYQWLKKQVYEDQAQKVYDFQKQLSAAKNEDAKSFGNSIIGKGLKAFGNAAVDVVSSIKLGPSDPYGWQNTAKTEITKWGNERQQQVIDAHNKYNNQVKDRIKKIDQSQIRSHNSNKNALNAYKNVIIRERKR